MRIALGITYNGQAYSGWQSQPNGRAVQDHLERALERFATQPVRTLCAGRTDAGVHALMQVAHFDTEVERPPFSWVRGTNRFLPPDIAVQWARVVPQAFHARASATARRYSYILLQSPVRPSLESGRVGWVFGELDQQAMEAGARYLLGTHDFTSLRAAICQAASPVKTMRHIGIRRCRPSGTMPAQDDAAYWRFDFEADAFLHHMIRNIMGCLLAIGQGRQPPQWMQAVLDARSRDAAAPTFPAHGLYFLGPVYDAHWGVPPRTPGFDWLPQ